MRKFLFVLLACSLFALMLGILLDLSKVLTGSMVLSGCLAGTLIGDTIKNKGSIANDMKVGLLVLGGLCILLMGLFIVNDFMHLNLLPAPMPKLVIGVFCFASLSIVACIILTWYWGRRKKV